MGKGREKRRRRNRTKPSLSCGAVAGDAQNYMNSLNGAIDGAVERIHSVSNQYRNNTPWSRRGFIAETDATGTLNIDAAFKRVNEVATRVDSNKAMSPDIAILADGKEVGLVSQKVFADAAKSAKAQRGYTGMQRVVPSDQLDLGRDSLVRQARRLHKQGRTSDAVKSEESARQLTDRVRGESAESQPRSMKELRALERRAKQGGVTDGDVVGGALQRAKQGAIAGAKGGAVASAAITGVVQSAIAVKQYNDGLITGEEAVVQVVRHTAVATVEGTIKGAAAGSVTALARAAAPRAASSLGKAMLRGPGPAAAAIFAVELAVHGANLSRGAIDGDEFKSRVKGSATSGVGALVGGAVGSAFGPVGTVVGSVIGSFVGGWFR